MSTSGEFRTFQEMLDEHVRQETGRAMLDRERLHEILDKLLFFKRSAIHGPVWTQTRFELILARGSTRSPSMQKF